jgi:hypothetical protein
MTSTGFRPWMRFVSGGFASLVDVIRLSESLGSEFSRWSLSSMDTNVVVGLVELLVCIDSALLRFRELDGVAEVDLVSRQFCFDRKLSVLKN